MADEIDWKRVSLKVDDAKFLGRREFSKEEIPSPWDGNGPIKWEGEATMPMLDAELTHDWLSSVSLSPSLEEARRLLDEEFQARLDGQESQKLDQPGPRVPLPSPQHVSAEEVSHREKPDVVSEKSLDVEVSPCQTCSHAEGAESSIKDGQP